MTTNQPTGRCPSCGIGRFLPSGLCDHCGAQKPKSRAALSLEPMQLTVEEAERLENSSAKPTITPLALPHAYVSAGERLMQKVRREQPETSE